jgi:hypothetical protein
MSFCLIKDDKQFYVTLEVTEEGNLAALSPEQNRRMIEWVKGRGCVDALATLRVQVTGDINRSVSSSRLDKNCTGYPIQCPRRSMLRRLTALEDRRLVIEPSNHRTITPVESPPRTSLTMPSVAYKERQKPC